MAGELFLGFSGADNRECTGGQTEQHQATGFGNVRVHHNVVHGKIAVVRERDGIKRGGNEPTGGTGNRIPV